MNMLAIDTSTQMMGVALLKENNIVAEMRLLTKNDHSSRLMPSIQTLMDQANMEPHVLDAIVVTKGPGSYTGTRIGITTAKTLAWSLDIPIKAVSSLKLIAAHGGYFNGLICPFIDARRGTVYTGLYRWNRGKLEQVKEEENILFTSWLEGLKKISEPILFVGDNLSVFQPQIETSGINAIIPTAPDQHIQPSHLFTLASEEAYAPAHELVPNYMRRTEAEAKWLEQQRNSGSGDPTRG